MIPAHVVSPLPKGGLILLTLATMAIFAVVFGLRWWHPTPRCMNDEMRYTEIIKATSLGAAHPVSGPGFVRMVSNVESATSLALPRAVGAVGIFGAGLLLAAMWLVFRRTVPQQALAAITVVACSTYFWAGISESRPQLFGYSGLLVSVWLLGELLSAAKPKVGHMLSLAALSALIAFAHILTFFVLCGLCVAAMLALQYERDAASGSAVSRAILAAMMVGAAVIFWPDGPYHEMIIDIRTAHLTNKTLLLTTVIAAAAACMMAVRIARKHRDAMANSASRLLQRLNPDRVVWATASVALLLFSAQAVLLPKDYWLVYGHSVPRFIVSQAGNLVYAAFFLCGTRECLYLARAGKLERGALTFVAATAVTALVASALLLLSLGLLHTNWMLRAIDFAVIFGSPIGAFGLIRIWRGNSGIATLMLGAGLSASVVAGSKSPLLFVTC